VDWWLTIGGFVVGVTVGLTGMGGGALMTPMLVLVFHVPPLAAVSSDLVTSAVMKPVGGFVHLRKHTVNLQLVKWLAIGSVPSAFAGVFVLRAMGSGDRIQQQVKVCLGVALLIAAVGLMVKTYLALIERVRRRRAGLRATRGSSRPVVTVRPMATVAVGAVGGLIVGMTSVGSGSLIIVALIALYPTLKASDLVGTDLVQAIPLVAAAALGHLLYGDFQLSITTSLLVGCLPGVYLGAQLSSRAPGGIVRRALTLVLVASGLKLMGLGTTGLAWVLFIVIITGPALWAWARVGHGLPALAHNELKVRREQAAGH
jgi:uncharacterized membrane protein YfcA